MADSVIGLDELMACSADALFDIQTAAEGPPGELPLSEQMLREWPSGDLFGLTQNTAMGWSPDLLLGPQYLILSTQGGLRRDDGQPIALGFHTGHWEVGLLVQAAAETFKELGGLPFAASCSDPCDGRTQGTSGMFDSLPYRNDAATVLGRLIRSLPRRRGVLGVATCDKGLPAMMMALARAHRLPCVLVPGGVTLPPIEGEDAAKIQTIGARFAHGEITREEAAKAGCNSCATPGGGCQFMGTAATSQVVAEALGLALPHSALAPSGQPIWLQLARQSARALAELDRRGLCVQDLLTPAAFRNAMVVHAACGGSTNLLLHLPAIAYAAGVAEAIGARLERRQSPHAAVSRRPAERAAKPPHGACLPGRGCPGNHAPPARTPTTGPGCTDKFRSLARNGPGLVARLGTATATASTAARTRRSVAGRCDHVTRIRARARSDQYCLLPGRQPLPRGIRDQSDVN